MKPLSDDAVQFIRELRSANIDRTAIVREAKKRYPDQHVTRWSVELTLYPKIVERLERERKAREASKALIVRKPREPKPQVQTAEPADMLDGVPNLPQLLAWVERAKQRMPPGDTEAAFDISTALRRLDLVERTCAYRSTNQAARAASIQ